MFKQIIFFVLSFGIPFALKYAFAEQMPVFYVCKGEKSAFQNAKQVSCNSANDVIDAVQIQLDFLVQSRAGYEVEGECGREYAFLRRMREENPSVLQQRAPKTLAICNDAVSQIKR
jgi:hypothetical protein